VPKAFNQDSDHAVTFLICGQALTRDEERRIVDAISLTIADPLLPR
jgi:hypothetical protein